MTAPTWSPDGKLLVVSVLFDGKMTSTLLSIDVNSGEQKVVTASNSMLEDPVWMPDGKNLLLLSTSPETNFNSAQLALLSYPDGLLTQLTKDTSNYRTISVSSDGRTIATSQGQPVTALQIAPYTRTGAWGTRPAFPIARRLTRLAGLPPENW